MKGGGALLKSVTLFLGGRRGSRGPSTSQPPPSSPRRPQQSPGHPQQQGTGRKPRKMGDDKTPRQQALNSKQTSAKVLDHLKKQTHFSRQEIEALSKVYKKLLESHTLNGPVPAVTSNLPSMQPSIVKGEGLDRMVFRELLHNTFDVVTEEVLMDRIFCAFDRCNVGVIRLEEWVCGLSGFLRGSHDEKTAFAFFVYDLNSDGFISREEMFHLLRNSLVKSPQDEDPDEGVRDLVELALRKMDYDRDGKISFQDFKTAVTEEPLLLEAFGQCLPADTACQTFLSTLQC
ncbi:calaxin [Macrosteles quadrilineatus]|uniref:calaxin n=1 Tax=Macrosteles quadrilineatus TaxID=74068 RepID=UPI0023E249B1|nr:calaxin [Macrosteles quadrilineatus]